MREIRLVLGALASLWSLLFFCFPAFAEDKPAEEAKPTEAKPAAAMHEYSPEHCEFSIAFPKEPYRSRQCEDGKPDRCYDLVSYTQVYNLATTVNFKVICSKIDQGVYDHYNEEVMRTTLRAMTDRSVIKTFDMNFREDNGFKQAGLVGEGQAGTGSTLFIAQLWIGHQSAFSVQAELVGAQDEAAETLFSEILKSAHFSGVKNQKTEDKKAEDDKDEEKTEEEKKEKE